MRLFISTIGTSVLTNGASPEDRDLVVDAANLAETEFHQHPRREQIEELVESARKRLEIADEDDTRRISAELNGWLTFCQKRQSRQRADHHILVASDTLLGSRCADLVKAKIEALGGGSVDTPHFKGLRTSNTEDLQEGLGEVFKFLHESIPGYRARGYEIVFNLSGSFKGIVAPLTAAAMLYRAEVVLIFESGQLLSVPGLPIRLEDAEFRDHFQLYRRASIEGSIPRGELPNASAAYWTTVGEDADLNAWGQLLWQEAKSTLYKEKIWPSPTTLIKFGERFEESARGLQPNILRDSNNSIDQLARYAQKGEAAASLRIQPYRSRPGVMEARVSTGDKGYRLFFVNKGSPQPDARELELLEIVPGEH